MNRTVLDLSCYSTAITDDERETRNKATITVREPSNEPLMKIHQIK